MNAAEGSPVHAEAGELLAWMDDQLPPREAAELSEHLEKCESCSGLLRDLQAASELMSEALQEGDGPHPRHPAAWLRRRARRRRLTRSVPAAAALVLVFVGAASALVPGSRFRSWLGGLARQPATPPTAVASPSYVTQLSVISPDSIDIFLGAPRDTLDLELVRSDGPRIEVETASGETLDRLEFGSGRLHVDPGSARRLRILFPRTDRVRILLRGRDLLSESNAFPGVRRSVDDSTSMVRIGPAG